MWRFPGRFAWAGWLLAFSLVARCAMAVAGPKAGHGKMLAKMPWRGTARSIGAPNHGRLEGGALLKHDKYLRQRDGAHGWALPEMVRLLHHAAHHVARKHKGSVMFVGDLSGRTGGRIDRHRSHQTGRDADVGFYAATVHGKPLALQRFVAFDDAGKARDLPGVYFDEPRNWALMEALLKDSGANVRYLFVTNSLRARLLAYAAKRRVPKPLIERAAAAMMSPADADAHDDHVHVRMACPPSMRDVCVEESVMRDDHPTALGAEEYP